MPAAARAVEEPELEEIEEQAIEALKTLEEKLGRLYYRGGILVDVRRLSDGTIKESPLTKSLLETHLKRYMVTWDKDAIKDVASHILANYDPSEFNTLNGIHTMPVLRPNFTLVEPGFDPETGFLYQPIDKVKAHQFNENPTPGHAAKAYQKLRYPFADFPFVTEADKTNTIAFVLTLVARTALDYLCPALVIDAAGQSSGKSLQGEAISLISQGKKMKWVSMDKGISEVEKGVKSDLVAHQKLIGVDNVVGTFRSPVITSLLTSFDPSIRMFGTLSRNSGTKNANFMFNGNAMKFDTDLRKRVYWVKMWHQDPASRDKQAFKVFQDHGVDLMTYLSSHWLEYYDAAMTIIQAWRVAGMPKRKPSSSLDKYASWEAAIGGMLEFCGAKDFLQGHSEHSLAADDELQEVVSFIKLVSETFPESTNLGKGVQKSKLVDKLLNEWKGVLPELKGDTVVLMQNNLGKWLAKKYGLNIGGFVLNEKRHPTERCLTVKAI